MRFINGYDHLTSYFIISPYLNCVQTNLFVPYLCHTNSLTLIMFNKSNKKETMDTTMIKNLKLEVIATYEDSEQEIFQTKLTKEVLKNETSLLNFIRSILDYATDSDLSKLSFCFICKDDLLKKYKTIEESIYKRQGKYFFQDNQLIN